MVTIILRKSFNRITTVILAFEDQLCLGLAKTDNKIINK